MSDPRVSKSLNVDSILARQNDGMPVIPVLSSAPSKGLIAYDTASNGTTGWPFIADGAVWRPVLLSVSSLAGTGLSLVIGPVPVLSITPTGVVPGVYGTNTMTPQITVNAQGQITSIVNIPTYPQVGCQVRFNSGTLQVFVAPAFANISGYDLTDITGFTVASQPLFTSAAGSFTCTAAGVYTITSNVLGLSLFGVGPYTFVATLYHNGGSLAQNWTFYPSGTAGCTIGATVRLVPGDVIRTEIAYTVPASQLQVFAGSSLLIQRIYN